MVLENFTIQINKNIKKYYFNSIFLLYKFYNNWNNKSKKYKNKR